MTGSSQTNSSERVPAFLYRISMIREMRKRKGRIRMTFIGLRDEIFMIDKKDNRNLRS